MTIGGFTYTTNGLGFTNAKLPGTNCTADGFTQFSLHNLQPPTDSPWGEFRGPGVLILSYRDLLVQDSFPLVPTSLALSTSSNRPQYPSPATLTLFGIGLAVTHRIRKRRAP